MTEYPTSLDNLAGDDLGFQYDRTLPGVAEISGNTKSSSPYSSGEGCTALDDLDLFTDPC